MQLAPFVTATPVHSVLLQPRNRRKQCATKTLITTQSFPLGDPVCLTAVPVRQETACVVCM